ncbi:MAG: sugar phosphate isomerase/epimerase family protein [Candidatus Hodarchaeota archaeon]
MSFFLREYKQNGWNLEQTLQQVVEYDFDFFTLNLSYPLMERHTARQVGHMIEDLGLELACHGPYELFLGSVQESTRRAMVKLSQSCLKWADAVNAVYCNFHFFECQYFFLDFGEAKHLVAKQSRKSVQEICKFAKEIETDVNIAFETPPDRISEDISLVSEALEPENAFFLLDVGHAMRVSQDPLVYLSDERIRTKTIACHLHDVKNNVDHYPIGDGILNWSHIVKSLKNLPNLRYGIFECGDYNQEGTLTIANLTKIRQIQCLWMKFWNL